MRLRQSLKTLWQISRSARVGVVLSSLLGGAYVCCSMLFVWTSKLLIDAVTGRSEGEVGELILPYIAIIIFQIIFFLSTSYINSRNLVRFRVVMREKLFSRIIESQYRGSEDLHSADMTNRLDEDSRVVGEAICNNLPSAIIALLQLSAAFLFMLLLQPRLAWLLILIMPLAVLVSKVFITKMRAVTHSIRESDSNIQSHIQESIENRVNISAFGRGRYVDGILKSLQQRLINNEHKRINISLYTRSALNLGFMAGYATAFLWGIFGLQSGAITFGLMTAFMQLVAQIQNPVVNLSQKLPSFVAALTSAERITEVAKLPLQEQGEQITLGGVAGIEVENISFRYEEGQRWIFSNFSHIFRPSTITAITGETGAGKSTLIKLILAILSPENGSITIFNDQERHIVSPLLRTNICYVPQGNTLISGTLRENLQLGDPSATDAQMWQALRTACCDFVDSLDSTFQERGAGLSEGQAQRIAIARSLLGKGSILLLDEPSSSLDPTTERELMENLRGEASNKTIIIITHRQAPIEACDDVLKIKRD